MYMPVLFSFFHLAGGESMKVLWKWSKVSVSGGAFHFVYMLFEIAICTRKKM